MSVSASPSAASDDLAIIARGGPEFSERLGRLVASRLASEEAYTALQIGKQARAEYDRAEALAAQADKALSDAKGAAAHLIHEAQEKASCIVKDANAAAVTLREEASQVRSGAAVLRNDIATQVEAARTIKADAEAQAAEVAKAAADLAAEREAVAAQHAQLQVLMQAATAAESRWQAALTSLQSLIEKA